MFISLTSSSCENEKATNSPKIEMGKLITSEAIFADLKKDNPDLEKDDVCIDASQYFKTLFIVGFFAHDRGCGNNNYYYQGDKIELSKDVIKQILLDNDFKSNPSKLVESYHIEVINHNNSCLSTQPERFDTINFNFHIPTVIVENGQIISSIWVQQPGGMMPEDVFHKSIVVFHEDGTLDYHKKTDKYTVPYH